MRHSFRANSPFAYLLICCAAGLMSCGSESGSPSALSAAAETADTAVSLQPLPEPALMQQLTDELERVLAEAGTAKRSSAAPQGKGSAVCDLSVYNTAGGSRFSWTYRQQGDYDLNGSVGISDLTQIGLHFGKDQLSADWQQAQLADGDGNGVVNIGDVTPLGQNFGGRVDGFELQGRIGGGEWSSGARFDYPGGNPASGKYYEFTSEGGFVIGSPEYRVVPFVEQGGQYMYGTPGNIFAWGHSARDNWNAQRANLQRDGLSRTEGPTDSSEVWTLPLEGCAMFSEAVSDHTETIYIGTYHGGLLEDSGGMIYAVDFAGHPRWQFRCARGIAASAAVSVEGRIVFGELGGRISCIAADGKLYWTRHLPGSVIGAGPLLDAQGNTYVLLSQGNGLDFTSSTLFKLNREGGIEWDAPLDDYSIVPPCFDHLGRVVVVDSSGRYYAFSSGGMLADSQMLAAEPAGGLLSKHVAIHDQDLIASLVDKQMELADMSGGMSQVLNFADFISSGVSCNPAGQMAFVSRTDESNSKTMLNLYDAGFEIWSVALSGNQNSAVSVDSAGRNYVATMQFQAELLEPAELETEIELQLLEETDLVLKNTSLAAQNGIHCIDIDGSTLWYYPTGEAWPTAMSIVGDDLLAVSLTAGMPSALHNGANSELMGINGPGA